MLPAQYNQKSSNYFCRFTFGQFFTLLVIEIFTLFFIFYLGARYGGELLGVHSPTLAVQERSGLPEVILTDPNAIATTHDPEVKALAKDILKTAPSPDLKQRVEEMLKEDQVKEAATPPAELRTAPRPEVPLVAAIPKPEMPSPSPPPPPIIQTATTDAHYSIQVGSYPNPDEAHTFVAYWKQKGYNAYLVSADIPNKGRWYRVRLGGFDTKEDADSYLHELQSKENIEAFVSVNE